MTNFDTTLEMRAIHYDSASDSYVQTSNQIKAEISSLDYNVNRIYLFNKRLLDIFASFFAIIILLPILLVVSLLVKFTSKGPVLFKDKRVGLEGEDIYVWKFRSMYIDAESRLEHYLTPEQLIEWHKERKIVDDPRITKVGKFIRATSLDELPQLLNIFVGDISIVGPRPVTMHEIEDNYTNEEKQIILSCKPGLTGHWQVSGRNSKTYESGNRQRMELEYAVKRSFWFDMKIIVLTIPSVLFAKGR